MTLHTMNVLPIEIKHPKQFLNAKVPVAVLVLDGLLVLGLVGLTLLQQPLQAQQRASEVQGRSEVAISYSPRAAKHALLLASLDWPRYSRSGLSCGANLSMAKEYS